MIYESGWVQTTDVRVTLGSAYSDTMLWRHAIRVTSRVWHFGSRDAIGRLIIRIAVGHFLLLVIWNQLASICNGFYDIQWRMWRNERWHGLKQPL